jgi:hypothetical protein
MENKTKTDITRHLRTCRLLAVEKYGVDKNVVDAWKDWAFSSDCDADLSPTESVEIRIREAQYRPFLGRGFSPAGTGALA